MAVESKNRLQKITIMFASLLIVGVIGYRVLLHANFVDALYMTVITISTVGYKEIADMDTSAKLFSILLIFWGLGVVGYAFSTLVMMIVDGKIKEIWRGRRMEKAIEKLHGHYIICGAGEIAEVTVAQFIKENKPYVLVEEQLDIVQEYQQRNIVTYLGSSTSREVLCAVGIKRAAGLIAVCQKDVDNIVTVLTARELCPDIYIAALSHDPSAVEKLLRVGASKTISTSEIGGRRLAALMTKPEVMGFLDVLTHMGDVDLSLEEIDVRPGAPILGQTIRDAQIAQKTGLIILAMKRKDEALKLNPPSSFVFQLGDKMLVMGEVEKMQKLQQLAGWPA